MAVAGHADSCWAGGRTASRAGCGARAGSGQPPSSFDSRARTGSGPRTGLGARAGSGHPSSSGSGAGSSWYAACAAASSKGGGSETQPPGCDCAGRPLECDAGADGPVVADPPEACPTWADTVTVRPVTSRMAFSTSAPRGPREKALTIASTGKSRTTVEPSTAPSWALPPTIDHVTRLMEDRRSTTSFQRPRSMSASRPPGAWAAGASRRALCWLDASRRAGSWLRASGRSRDGRCAGASGRSERSGRDCAGASGRSFEGRSLAGRPNRSPAGGLSPAPAGRSCAGRYAGSGVASGERGAGLDEPQSGPLPHAGTPCAAGAAGEDDAGAGACPEGAEASARSCFLRARASRASRAPKRPEEASGDEAGDAWRGAPPPVMPTVPCTGPGAGAAVGVGTRMRPTRSSSCRRGEVAPVMARRASSVRSAARERPWGPQFWA